MNKLGYVCMFSWILFTLIKKQDKWAYVFLYFVKDLKDVSFSNSQVYNVLLNLDNCTCVEILYSQIRTDWIYISKSKTFK